MSLAIINKLCEKLAYFKVYFVRASTYISIINFILIIATFKKTYNINISNYIVIPIGLIIGLLAGFLDYKLILKHETIHNNKKNNVKDQIDNIEKQLKLLINKNENK